VWLNLDHDEPNLWQTASSNVAPVVSSSYKTVTKVQPYHCKGLMVVRAAQREGAYTVAVACLAGTDTVCVVIALYMYVLTAQLPRQAQERG
jgi:hypothetical protein